MFDTLGGLIARRPVWMVSFWILMAVVGTVWALRVEKPPPDEMGSFLPADAPYNVAVETLGRAFPRMSSRSQIVVIAERPTGITPTDLAWLDRIAQDAAGTVDRGILSGVLSPSAAALRPRLVSRDRADTPQREDRAAMLVVNLRTNMISGASAEAVNVVESLKAARPPPQGLRVELTGSAAIGRDYALATSQALHRTTWVTVLAVLGILILVYRSPVGAFVPLIAIGLSAYLAFIVLAVLVKFAGWEVSTIERIFVIVLVFGAGVDYALFWIARYRETIALDPDLRRAAIEATRHAGPAILFSALTTMLGMASLMVAQLGPSRGAGKVLQVALGLALLAGLTLAPAIARLMGRALFWPVGTTAAPAFAQRIIWPALAARVVRAPRTFLVVGLLALAIPAALALRMQPRFDSLSELPPGTTSAYGFEIAQEHFSKGQLYSNMLTLAFREPLAGPEAWGDLSGDIRRRVLRIDGVEDVYSLDAPLGAASAPQKANALSRLFSGLLEGASERLYRSETIPALRFEVLIDYAPFSLEAMDVIDRVRVIAEEEVRAAATAGRAADVHLTGLTPYIMAVRDVAGVDQRKVMVLASVLIAVVVLLLVRDVPLGLFMVFATLLTYGATLKLTELFFVHAMGMQGIDWKVRLIVFVIVVAVGQDYNIFLVSRLLEERREHGNAEAVRRSVVSTGAVISSCGIIMAATLGSLWAGGLSLLRQVGFALALGILIDTYFVRPLLIPSFFLVLHPGRNGRS